MLKIVLLSGLAVACLGLDIGPEQHGKPQTQTSADCTYEGKHYANGEDFEQGCVARCSCKDGAVGCMDYCGTSFPNPDIGKDCRDVYSSGQCCPKWVCDSDKNAGCDAKPAVSDWKPTSNWTDLLGCTGAAKDCSLPELTCPGVVLQDRLILTTRRCLKKLMKFWAKQGVDWVKSALEGPAEVGELKPGQIAPVKLRVAFSKSLALVNLREYAIKLTKTNRPVNLPLSYDHCKRLQAEACSVRTTYSGDLYTVNSQQCRLKPGNRYFWITSEKEGERHRHKHHQRGSRAASFNAPPPPSESGTSILDVEYEDEGPQPSEVPPEKEVTSQKGHQKNASSTTKGPAGPNQVPPTTTEDRVHGEAVVATSDGIEYLIGLMHSTYEAAAEGEDTEEYENPEGENMDTDATPTMEPVSLFCHTVTSICPYIDWIEARTRDFKQPLIAYNKDDSKTAKAAVAAAKHDFTFHDD
jgi:hypothetical protein